ncbi:hypothetical protein WG66_009004 [Moniliophthora roreri]|nr:hypothetical protein WG66_009004 [Moniliophthora roreri]
MAGLYDLALLIIDPGEGLGVWSCRIIQSPKCPPADFLHLENMHRLSFASWETYGICCGRDCQAARLEEATISRFGIRTSYDTSSQCRSILDFSAFALETRILGNGRRQQDVSPGEHKSSMLSEDYNHAKASEDSPFLRDSRKIMNPSYAFRIVFGLGASTGILFTARADKGASLKAHRDLPEPSLGILISELGRREMVTGDRLDVIGVSRTMRVKNDENLADPFSRDEPNVKLVNENAISSTLPTSALYSRYLGCMALTRFVLHELEVSRSAIPLVDEVEGKEYYTSWHYQIFQTEMTTNRCSVPLEHMNPDQCLHRPYGLRYPALLLEKLHGVRDAIVDGRTPLSSEDLNHANAKAKFPRIVQHATRKTCPSFVTPEDRSPRSASASIFISELGGQEMVIGDRLGVMGRVSRVMRIEKSAYTHFRSTKLANENAVSSTLPTVPLCIRDKWHDTNEWSCLQPLRVDDTADSFSSCAGCAGRELMKPHLSQNFLDGTYTDDTGRVIYKVSTASTPSSMTRRLSAGFFPQTSIYLEETQTQTLAHANLGRIDWRTLLSSLILDQQIETKHLFRREGWSGKLFGRVRWEGIQLVPKDRNDSLVAKYHWGDMEITEEKRRFILLRSIWLT